MHISKRVNKNRIPGDQFTERTFKLASEKNILFEAEQVSFDKETGSLKIKIVNYSSSNLDQFKLQQPQSPIKHLLFEKMDWSKFSTLAYSYTMSKLKNNFFNTEEPYFRLIPDEAASRISEPTYTTKQKTIKIKFADSRFNDGSIRFNTSLKRFGMEKEFFIDNSYLKQEFENIKAWFIRKIGKTFKATFTLTLKGEIVENISVTSEEIQGINEELIDSIKESRVINLTKEVGKKDKLIYDSTDIFEILEDGIQGSSIVDSSDQSIIEILIKNEIAKNVRQLQYLSQHRHAKSEKIRFTLKPQFGFVFKIVEPDKQFFVWELLNSHATYIWGASSDVSDFYATVEEQISLIINSGRENYKHYYKKLDNESFDFSTIYHENSDKIGEERFDVWKEKLNAVIMAEALG